VPTSKVKHSLSKTYPSKRIEVVGRGVESKIFRPHGTVGPKLTALYVGRVSVEKDLEKLAFFGRHNDIQLIIVGDGKDIGGIRNRLPFADFKGRLKGRDLVREYRRSDVFVFPSITDAYANVVSEALCSGLPVVAFDDAGVEDRVKDGRNGFLVSGDSEFEKAVLKLRNPRLRERMSHNARQTALDLKWDVVFEKQLKAVAQTHKDGGKTQSLGWRIPFSEDTTKELLMRTQTTAVSARQLMSKDLEIPGKYFTIGRCYRPDVIDATHLTEFNQLEGIVLGENVSFRQVLGMLESFCKKMTGANKVKFLPGYFPFTEPSVEGFIYHPKLNKWIEVAPAGIFRPELTEPLGIKVPVLAWGLGVDRLFMIKEGINDIRHLFSYDLDWLRRAKL